MWNNQISQSLVNKDYSKFDDSNRQNKIKQNHLYSSHPLNFNQTVTPNKIRKNIQKIQKLMQEKLLIDCTTKSQIKEELDYQNKIYQNKLKYRPTNQDIYSSQKSSIYLQIHKNKQKKKKNQQNQEKSNSRKINHFQRNLDNYQVETLKNKNIKAYTGYTYDYSKKSREKNLSKSKSHPKLNFQTSKCQIPINNLKAQSKQQKNNISSYQNKKYSEWKNYIPNQNTKFQHQNKNKSQYFKKQINQNQKLKFQKRQTQKYTYSYQQLLVKIKQYQNIILNVCNAYNDMKIYRQMQDRQILKGKNQIQNLINDNQYYKLTCSQDLKNKNSFNQQTQRQHVERFIKVQQINKKQIQESPIKLCQKKEKHQNCSSRFMKNISSLKAIKNSIIQGLNYVKQSHLKHSSQQQKEGQQYPIMRLNTKRINKTFNINFNEKKNQQQLNRQIQKKCNINCQYQLKLKHNFGQIKTPSFNNKNNHSKSHVITHQLYKINNHNNNYPYGHYRNSSDVSSRIVNTYTNQNDKVLNQEEESKLKDSEIEQLKQNQAQLLDKMRQKDLMIDQMMTLLIGKSKELW